MSNVPWKDLKYSRFSNNHVRSVYCSSKKFSDLNQNGCEIVRAAVTPEIKEWLLPKTSLQISMAHFHEESISYIFSTTADNKSAAWIACYTVY